mmetsp:Transcript_14605/g.24908  ORF Transcript_14605/g.24908 Transcript_14605/m.24908 type:complete len:182 (-) Transcript_14605:696-1241(-)
MVGSQLKFTLLRQKVTYLKSVREGPENPNAKQREEDDDDDMDDEQIERDMMRSSINMRANKLNNFEFLEPQAFLLSKEDEDLVLTQKYCNGIDLMNSSRKILFKEGALQLSFYPQEATPEVRRCHPIKSQTFKHSTGKEGSSLQVFPFSNTEELVFLRRNPNYLFETFLRLLKLRPEENMV